MAIRSGFLVVLIGFLVFLGSGAFSSSGADDVSLPRDHAGSVIPAPSHENLARGDLSLEPMSQERGSARATVFPADPHPSADPAVAVPDIATAPTNIPPAYPVMVTPQVQYFLQRFTGQYRAIVGTWLARSGRYLGMIREILRIRGLPEELAFTAMIESGFNPMAVSRAGAVGLWQFMAATARRYGLRVDSWVDERLDPEKSTFAAAAYLRDLHQQFGSWMLAQAAYNAGEVRVLRAIRATGSTDFWALARTGLLKRETKEFVPQIIAATLIGRDPAQYGFETNETTMTAFELVSVPPATELRRLATATGLSLDTLRGLNPTLVRGTTPPGSAYDLKIPVGTAPAVVAALDAPKNLMAKASFPARAARTSPVHVVRSRDTVTSIARHYGVSVGDVLRWNSLDKQDQIRPGDRLRVADTRLSRERQASVR